jgi:glucan phosphoethanolaminetransferase (alkaline phosphatase superfamily)
MPTGRRREWWTAVAFTAAVWAFETWRLPVGWRDYFEAPDLPSWRGIAVHVAGIAAIFGAEILFVRAALVSSRAWRAVYLVLFAGAAFVQYGYVSATGFFASARDLDLALDNTRLWLPMAGVFLTWPALVPSLGFAAVIATGRRLPAGHVRRFVVVVLATASVHSVYAASAFLHRAQDVGMTSVHAVPTGSFEGLARAVTFQAWNRAADRLDLRLRRPIAYQAATTPTTHIVFVIDESVTAGHLSVAGYPRATTPWLDALARDGRLDSWGIASSAVTQSTGSVACLLTGVNVVPDVEHRVYSQPTIFQFARAMNYRTHLFDGESLVPRFGMGQEDLKFVDDWRTRDFGDDPDTDFRMARAVAKLLEEPSGQFIVVLKRGNHFPYGQAVPGGQGFWQPAAYTPSPTPADRLKLVNSYDNGIRYNLDRFFQELLGASGVPQRTVVIYTSDHGARVNSGAPLDRLIAWEQTAVPLLMFGEARPKVDTGYRASHHNVFATLLDLMRVPDEIRPAAYGRSLLRARATDHDTRVVLSGLLTDPHLANVGDFDALVPPDLQPPH